MTEAAKAVENTEPDVVSPILRGLSPYWGAILVDGRPLVEAPTLRDQIALIFCPWIKQLRLEEFDQLGPERAPLDVYLASKLKELSFFG